MSDQILEQHGNILAFKKPARPLEIKNGGGRQCRHLEGVYVDIEKRELTCQACGAVIDPMDFVIDLATEIRNIDYRLSEWRDMHEKSNAADWDRRAKREAAKIRSRPEEDGEAKRVWDECVEFLRADGREISAICRSRGAHGGWYCETLLEGGTIRASGALSIGYIRDCMQAQGWADNHAKVKRERKESRQSKLRGLE